MDADLRELLAVWLGQEDPGDERRAVLLARLREDTAFRQMFLDEIRLLGMLKVVQSSEPRWLRLEDELGWSAGERDISAQLEERVMREVTAPQIRGMASQTVRRPQRPAWWAITGIAAAVLFLSLVSWLRREEKYLPAPPLQLGTVVRLDDVHWPLGTELTEGSTVTAGRLHLLAGHVSLAFYNGVALAIEGPADLELLAADRVFCRQGKLRARVPPGAEGFTVLTPGCEVVDLGAEFGLNQERDGLAQLLVFEGQAAVSVLGAGGQTLRGALIETLRSVEIEPSSATIRDIIPNPDSFAATPARWPSALALDPGYAAAVLGSRPWGYWRFEALDQGLVANEIASRPPLLALGNVQLEGAPGRNHWAVFRPDEPQQAFIMEGEWAPPREHGYALELWVRADAPGLRALVSLIASGEGPKEKHVALVELTARGGRPAHEPCVVRFLDRWPPSVSGGVNAFSRKTYVPDRWHHVVAQKTAENLELYVDGNLVAVVPGLTDTATTLCRLLVGRLKEWPPPSLVEIRPFAGRVDELAVYERPLAVEEIRHHARLRVSTGPHAP